MLSGTCPNSPAMLLEPRRSLPSIAIPTPTPSETSTKTIGSLHRPISRHRPDLGEDAGLDVVLDDDRQPGRGAQGRHEIHVAPFQGRRIEKARSIPVDHSRDHDADAGAFPHVPIRGQDPADPFRQVFDEGPGIRRRRVLLHFRERVSQKIRHENGGVARRDVDGQGAALSGLDVEVGGPPAPVRALALRALRTAGPPRSTLRQCGSPAHDACPGVSRGPLSRAGCFSRTRFRAIWRLIWREVP